MSSNVFLKNGAALLMTAMFVVGSTQLAAAEPGAIALSLERHAAAAASQPARPQANAARQPQARKTTSAWTKVAAGVLGGLGGFFAGGYIGAAIDGDCGGCDDPGLKGALIGAPIGAAVGATLGVVLASK